MHKINRQSLACQLQRHNRCAIAEDSGWECPCDCHPAAELQEKLKEAAARLAQYQKEVEESGW